MLFVETCNLLVDWPGVSPVSSALRQGFSWTVSQGDPALRAQSSGQCDICMCEVTKLWLFLGLQNPLLLSKPCPFSLHTCFFSTVISPSLPFSDFPSITIFLPLQWRTVELCSPLQSSPNQIVLFLLNTYYVQQGSRQQESSAQVLQAHTHNLLYDYFENNEFCNCCP